MAALCLNTPTRTHTENILESQFQLEVQTVMMGNNRRKIPEGHVLAEFLIELRGLSCIEPTGEDPEIPLWDEL